MALEPGVLYVVATPIGNLGDMTDRARQVLAQVDLIAAEDTRNTRRLLTHFQIKARLCAYHDHNEARMTERLIAMLSGGRSIALVADAGTPLISDPGHKLVRSARRRGLKVVPIPGPSAAICALCACGLPSDRFLFLGFPPRGSARRRQWLGDLAKEPGTLIFYESGKRTEAVLADMAEVLGEAREVVLARELTKHFETFLEGTLGSIGRRLSEDPMQLRGELVMLVAGHQTQAELPIEAEAQRVLAILSEALPLKQAAALAARITGAKKNQLYELALRSK